MRVEIFSFFFRAVHGSSPTRWSENLFGCSACLTGQSSAGRADVVRLTHRSSGALGVIRRCCYAPKSAVR